jgi:predicted MFS family arabinose efflux permease
LTSENNDRVGTKVGIFNTSFTLGGAAGIGIWSYLAVLLGWRTSYMISGILILICIFLILKGRFPSIQDPVDFKTFRNLFRDYKTIAIFLNAFLGSATSMLVDNFSVYYMESQLSLPAEIAGPIGTLAYLTTVLSALIGGRMFDYGTRIKTLLFAAGIFVFSGTATMAAHNVLFCVIGVSMVGIGVGLGGTSVFLGVTGKENPVAGVSMVDMSLSFGMLISPIYFPYLILNFGFDMAWIAGSFVLIPALVLLRGIR